MIEGYYYFGEHLRWNLGWANPNHAGAFLATLIPWFWFFRLRLINSPLKVLSVITFIIVELVVWFLICKTYSRGALISILIAGLIYLLLESRFQKDSLRRRLQYGMFALTFGVALGLLYYTGFWDRIDPAYIRNDASAGNRLSLWLGGLKLIAINPLWGYGSGLSGEYFMQWFQNYEADELHGGMVNSYLHFAVEYGLIKWAIALSVILFVLFLGGVVVAKSQTERCGSLALSALMSLVVFLFANLLSTMWLIENLWWIPGMAAAVIVICFGLSFRWPSQWKVVLWLGFFAVITSGSSALLLSRVATFFEDPIEISYLHEAKMFSVKSNESAVDKRVLFIADDSVFGEIYGKEVRRLAQKHPNLEFFSAIEAHSIKRTFDIVIVSGDFVFPESIHVNDPSHLIIINPARMTDGMSLDRFNKVTLIYPSFDVRGFSRQWKAIEHPNFEAINSGVLGQDIRPVWPSVTDSIHW